MATIVEINAHRCILPSNIGIRQELEVYRRTVDFPNHAAAVEFMHKLRELCERYPAVDPRSVAPEGDDEGTFSSSVL